jgi:hypothetical protein
MKLNIVIKFLIMRRLSIIILLGLLIILPSCKYFKGGLFGKKARTMAIMKAREDSVRVADSLQKVKEQFLRVEQIKVDSLRRVEEERLALESKYKYNIIVGSFITPEYAKGLSEEYRKQGYDPKIIKMEGSRFELVSIEAYDSFRKAVSRLEQFQDTVQLESWLYIKK